MLQRSGSSGEVCRSHPWVNSGSANAHVFQCVCVCERKRERERKRESTYSMCKREDKSFSCLSNILIFHECLFDVVLNIHVSMLWRKR